MTREQHRLRVTSAALLAALTAAGCGPQSQTVSLTPSAPDDACSESLQADYIPSEEYGSATPEEALQKYAIYYQRRVGESQSAAQHDRSQLLTNQAWARAAETAEVLDPSSDTPNNAVRATSTSDGQETASFLIRRADEGSPRWAVSEGWVLLPSEACEPVDELRRQDEQRQREAPR